MIERFAAMLAAVTFIMFITAYSTVRFEKYPEGVNVMAMSVSGLVLAVGLATGIVAVVIIGWLAVAGSMVHRTHLVIKARRTMNKETDDGQR